MDSGREVVIAGAAAMPMHMTADRPFYDRAFTVAREAVADAGLKGADIDSVVLAGLDLECGRTISNMYVAPAAAGYMKDEIRVADDGLYAAALAWMRLRSGIFGTTLVLAYGQSSETGQERLSNYVHDPVLQRPFGIGRTTALALQAQAYRANAEGADEAADAVALRHRLLGEGSARSLRLPATGAGGADDPTPVAFPLRRGHMAPLCDGVAAVVMRGVPKAKAGTGRALVRGFGWASSSGDLGARDVARPDATRRAAEMAMERAGAGMNDIGVVETHDVTAYHHCMALEGLGFASDGEGPAAALEDHDVAAINANGGALSGEPSVASGMYRLLSCLDGLAGSGRRLAMAHSTSGPAAQTACVGILERCA